MAKVGILTFSDGRDFFHRDIEKFCRNIVVCELLDYDGFGGVA